MLNTTAAKLGFLALLISNLSFAQDPMDSPLEPKELFMKMVQANTTEAYQGSMAFERAGQLTTFRVENVTGDNPQQNLRALNRPIPPHSHRTNCLDSDGEPLINIDNLSGLYNFYRPEDSIVAGRLASELLLLPVDSYRYGYGYSLDAENYLTLRTVILTPQRTPIERYEFVDIEFLGASEQIPADLVAADCSSIEQQALPWTTARVPDGFQTINSVYRMDSDRSELVLSDGLATISITLEPVIAPAFPSVNTNLGATNILLSYLFVNQNTYLATLVGEVPLQSLEFIVSGLIPSSDISVQ